MEFILAVVFISSWDLSFISVNYLSRCSVSSLVLASILLRNLLGNLSFFYSLLLLLLFDIFLSSLSLSLSLSLSPLSVPLVPSNTLSVSFLFLLPFLCCLHRVRLQFLELSLCIPLHHYLFAVLSFTLWLLSLIRSPPYAPPFSPLESTSPVGTLSFSRMHAYGECVCLLVSSLSSNFVKRTRVVLLLLLLVKILGPTRRGQVDSTTYTPFPCHGKQRSALTWM